MSKRSQRGIVFWLAIAVVAYALVSGGLALTRDPECPDGTTQRWRVIPPEWECEF